MTHRQIVLYCGLLMTLSAFSVDIMLPAFSNISESLDADYTLVQMTIPVFIFALGMGQLLCGSLSDRFGRRPVLIGGTLVFLAGALIAALAPDIHVLLFGRVLQGLGGAVGPVIARAIIRDLFTGRELGRNMALATAVFAFGPIVAPLVGAGFMLFADWRILFLLMAAFASALLFVAIFRLDETNKDLNANALRPATWIANTKALFAHPASRYFLCISGLIMSNMMIILVVIPRVYEVSFGIAGTLFAIMFAAHGVGIIIGQIANRRLIESRGLLAASIGGSLVLVFCCLLMVLLSLTGAMNAWVMTAILILFATSYLIVYANASAITMDPHGSIAGFASSFYGAFSQIVASSIAAMMAVWIGGDLIAFALAVTLISFLTLAALIIWKNGSYVHNAKAE